MNRNIIAAADAPRGYRYELTFDGLSWSTKPRSDRSNVEPTQLRYVDLAFAPKYGSLRVQLENVYTGERRRKSGTWSHVRSHSAIFCLFAAFLPMKRDRSMTNRFGIAIPLIVKHAGIVDAVGRNLTRLPARGEGKIRGDITATTDEKVARPERIRTTNFLIRSQRESQNHTNVQQVFKQE